MQFNTIILRSLLLVCYCICSQAMRLSRHDNLVEKWLTPPNTVSVARVPAEERTSIDLLTINTLSSLLQSSFDPADQGQESETMLQHPPRGPAETFGRSRIFDFQGDRKHLPKLSPSHENRSSILKRSAGYRSRCCYVDVFCFRGCLTLVRHRIRHRRNSPNVVPFQNYLR